MEETKKEKKPTRFGKMFAIISTINVDKDRVHKYLRKSYGVDHLSGLSDDKVEQMIKRLEEISKDPFELEVFKNKVNKEAEHVETGVGKLDAGKVEGGGGIAGKENVGDHE